RRVGRRAASRSQAVRGDARSRNRLGGVAVAVIAGQFRVAVRVGDQVRLVVGVVGRRGGVAAGVRDPGLIAVRVIGVARRARRVGVAGAVALGDGRVLAVGVPNRGCGVVPCVRARYVAVWRDLGELLAVGVVGTRGGGELAARVAVGRRGQ